MKKIIFMDVDGTLMDSMNGNRTISVSTVDAIHKAQANGYYVFVCTGRSKSEFTSEIVSVGFDGYIGASGGFIMINDEIVYHQKLSYTDVEKLVQYFEKHGVYYFLEGNRGIFAKEKTIHKLAEFSGIEEFVNNILKQSLVSYDEVNKISFVSDTLSYDEIEKEFKDDFYVVKASWIDGVNHAGEISLKGISKGTAIQYVLDLLNISYENTFAFGDSMNDKEMFEAVHTSIVMGNSQHDIQQYASFQTKSIQEDGIEYAMRYFSII